MSHELADFENIVRILVSFDPFPRRCFAECNHALAQTCRLSLMLTRFFFLPSPQTVEATVHFYESLKKERRTDGSLIDQEFRRVTFSFREDKIKIRSRFLLMQENAKLLVKDHFLYRSMCHYKSFQHICLLVLSFNYYTNLSMNYLLCNNWSSLIVSVIGVTYDLWYICHTNGNEWTKSKVITVLFHY